MSSAPLGNGILELLELAHAGGRACRCARPCCATRRRRGCTPAMLPMPQNVHSSRSRLQQRDRRGRAARRAQRAVHRVHQRRRGEVRLGCAPTAIAGARRLARPRGRGRGRRPPARSRRPRPCDERPGVAAHVLARLRHADHAGSTRGAGGRRGLAARPRSAAACRRRGASRPRAPAARRCSAPSPVPGVPAVEWPSRRLAATLAMPGPLSSASTSTPPVPSRSSTRATIAPSPRVLDDVGRRPR